MIYQDHRDFVFKIVHWYFTGNPLEESRVIRIASHCALAPPQTPLTGVWH